MSTSRPQDARKPALEAAAAEARRLGDSRIGTQHILLGLFHNPVSLAVQTLGLELADARAALDELDRTALAAIGLGVVSLNDPVPMPRRRRPALTSGARSTLHRAVQRALSEGEGTVEERHVLYALLTLRHPDPAHALLTALDVDTESARQRLEQHRDRER